LDPGAGLRRIPTGVAELDARLGGLESKRLYLIVGEEKSGRTTMALQTALIASARGLDVLWLDCGGRLHPARLMQLAARRGGDLARIKVSVPESYSEQARLLLWACDHVGEPGLIVADDFTYLHRVELAGPPSHAKWIYKRLAFQAALLRGVTRSKDVTSIATVDVHERPGAGQPQPVASSILSYYSDGEVWIHQLSPGWRVLKVVAGGELFEARVRIHEGGLG